MAWGGHSPQLYTSVKQLLAFIAKYNIPPAAVDQALGHPQHTGNLLPSWLGHLADSVIAQGHSPLIPAQARLSLLFTHADPIESLDAFIALLNALAPLEHEAEATNSKTQLGRSLDLLTDYQVDGETAIQAFNLLQTHLHRPDLWEKSLHDLVIAATFQAEKHYSLAEICQKVSQGAPHTFFASEPTEIMQAYEAIIASYNQPSTLLPNQAKPIHSWGKAEVSAWSSTLRQQHQATPEETLPGPLLDKLDKKGLAPQAELLAVIKRAAELTHGFSPR